MQVTKIKKSVAGCLLIITNLLLLAVSVLGAEQEFKTLELVRTYQSKENVRATYSELFPKQVIENTEKSIDFRDPGTGQLVKQLNKKEPEVLREEKHGKYTTVMEKTYDYTISTHQSLVMYTEYEGGYVKETEANPPSLYPQPQKRILYNRKGEVITELPPMLNYLEDSPDHNYFVATYDGEGKADFIYFYDMKGNLLKKQEMNAHIGLKYSSDSKYVKVEKYDPSLAFGEVYLFTKIGDFITKYDYGTALHDYLFDFHVSDNADLLLFSMFNNAYLISNDGRILWKKPYFQIMDCRFHTEKNYLIFYSMLDDKPMNESRKSITTVSLIDGELLDTIEDVELGQFTQNGFIIKKEGTYYEYTIK